jgi:hypothetical protein
MLYKHIILSCFAALTCSPVLAAVSQSWPGYLIDRSCRASIEGDSGSALSFARAQTKECLLLPSCHTAGYAVFCDGHWFNLDTQGNKLAEKYLAKTKRQKAFFVLVKGSLSGQTIKTKSITELEEPANAEK